MAEALKQDFGVDAQMQPGKGGIFDVTVDGNLIYSKHKTGRFPDDGEVTKLIRGSARAKSKP